MMIIIMYRYVGREGFWATAKRIHTECRCFHLVLALFTPHADGVIVAGSSTSGVPHSLTFQGLSDSVIICFSLFSYYQA